MKKKYLFLGDLDSINIEIIKNSHKYLKKKVKYILIGNIIDVKKKFKTSIIQFKYKTNL